MHPAINAVELFGFVTGAVNVWLLARENIWNWPVGLANNLAFVLLFASSGLYGDAGLQIVYIGLGVYGWWMWLHANGTSPLRVTRASGTMWKALAIVTPICSLILVWFLRRFTDSTVPVWDGLTTALSLSALYLQSRKLLESWWIWILADLIYIPLYLYKGLWLTSLLYAVFLLLCLFGLSSWRRAAERACSGSAGSGEGVLPGR